MKMHWRLLLASCLLALTSAAPKNHLPMMKLFDPKDQSDKDVLRFQSSVELEEQWESFKTTYGKTYSDDAEELVRKNIFAANLKIIESHNYLYSKGIKTYDLAVNAYADLELDEFLKQMTCYSFRNLPETKEGSTYMPPEVNFTLPTKVDWRTKGYVTPVKDQQQCGSCWAFSATGSLEGQNFRKTKKLVSLSEQNLVDCSTAQGNQGCNGGWMDYAFQYVKVNKGIDTEASYPYKATDGPCRFKRATVGGTCTGYKDIIKGSEKDLQNAIATVGPISVAIDAGHASFQLYHSGVYNEPQCSTTLLDHGVLAVGYDSTGGKDYYIVKNSWGLSWGNNGYIWMSRNRKNQCGIATAASYPLV